MNLTEWTIHALLIYSNNAVGNAFRPVSPNPPYFWATLTQCHKKTVVIEVPKNNRIVKNVSCAPMNTAMNAQYINSPNVKPKTAPVVFLGATAFFASLPALYSGGPKLSTSKPSFNWLLPGILPSAMSSADCVMAGS